MATDRPITATILGDWPDPDLVLVEDYHQKSDAPRDSEGHRIPRYFLRIHMDIAISEEVDVDVLRTFIQEDRGAELVEKVLQSAAPSGGGRGPAVLKAAVGA